MAGAPSTYENIQDIPLAVLFSWRGRNAGAYQSDAWAKNVFIEKDGEEIYSVKRPGLGYVGNFQASGGSWQVQGLAVENYSYQLGPGSSNANPYVMVNDQYLPLLTGVNDNTGSAAIPLGTYQVANSWYSGEQLSSNYPNEGIRTNQLTATFQSQYAIHAVRWTYNGGVGQYQKNVTTVTSPSVFTIIIVGVPRIVTVPLVPGMCSLDQTHYVLDANGNLWASAIGDPGTWPALNFTVVDLTIGATVAVASYKSYVVTFGTLGLQLWYDAGISPGSPLQGVQGGILAYGMYVNAPFTIAKTEESLIWLGGSVEGGLAVFELRDTSVTKISSSSVDRYLSSYFVPSANLSGLASSVYLRGSVCRVSGHEFYILTCIAPSAGAAGTGGTTLVYDTTTKNWSVWTQQTALAYGEGAMRQWQCLPISGGVTYMPDMTTGNVYQLSDSVYKDGTQNINVLLQTDNYNWGNMRWKIIPVTYPMLDTLPSTVYLSWTDDDYTTFNTPQAIDTSNTRKTLTRCGSTIQRAWQLTHTDNTSMRFFALSVEVIPGAL